MLIHIIYITYVLIQDVSGNDLVKGIGFSGKEEDGGGPVKHELYTLDIVFPDGINNPWNDRDHLGLPTMVQEIGLNKGWGLVADYGDTFNSDYDYLRFQTPSYREYVFKQPFVEKITFRLKCPSLFGDNESHDIISWWKAYVEGSYVKNEEEIIHRNLVGKIKVGDYYEVEYLKCYLIEFDSKEIIEINNENKVFSVATLVLDR